MHKADTVTFGYCVPLQVLCSTKGQSRSTLTSLARVIAVCHNECVQEFLIPLMKSPNLGKQYTYFPCEFTLSAVCMYVRIQLTVNLLYVS